MALYRAGRVLLLLVTAAVVGRATAEPRPAGKEAVPLADVIDRQLAARWAAAGVQPAPPADDAEFLRRVSLDLAGQIPSVAATREFLENPSPDKRRRLVDRLLQSPAYVRHFTNFWRATLLPENNTPEAVPLRAIFEASMRDRLTANVGYDRIVREILTARLPRGKSFSEEGFLAPQQEQSIALAFYAANDGKPENLAGSTARLFLAVKLECAQCHNHPFAKWRREQFWEYAAFFAAATQKGGSRTISIPNTNTVVTAHFLDGKAPSSSDRTDPRVLLADWMTAAENPYFARAAVNRLWAYIFGTGLVEPVDDLTQEKERQPLLDELARQFVEHGYDLKFLVRGMVLSRAYGLSSRTGPSDPDSLRLFARMPVKGLSPEQIFDNLVEATGYEGPTEPARSEFLTRFAHEADKRTEFQTSILQALGLMNGKFVAQATSLESSTTLGAVADAPFLDTAGRIEVLYLAALTRKPRADERARLVKYVERGGPSGDQHQALADVFWALLNSGEFLLNH